MLQANGLLVQKTPERGIHVLSSSLFQKKTGKRSQNVCLTKSTIMIKQCLLLCIDCSKSWKDGSMFV
jgi:hypothetical protein